MSGRQDAVIAWPGRAEAGSKTKERFLASLLIGT